MQEKRINCMACKHYYVTWDPQFPRGCRSFSFKSANLPSLEVLRSSGEACMKFTPKPACKPVKSKL
nr:uracil-DNA glycosylase [Peribacillus loiseleuriae]